MGKIIDFVDLENQNQITNKIGIYKIKI